MSSTMSNDECLSKDCPSSAAKLGDGLQLAESAKTIGNTTETIENGAKTIENGAERSNVNSTPTAWPPRAWHKFMLISKAAVYSQKRPNSIK